MIKRTFNFGQQLKMSHGVSLSFDFRQVLLTEIPNAINVKRASDTEDRSGTDWWVERLNNRPLSIDLKARDMDWVQHGQDDLALEIWSVVEDKVIGWTRDATKTSDYILWFWNDTRRWCLIPFPMLCRVFTLHWQEWQQTYKTATQQSDLNGHIYHSECVFVPRKILWTNLIEHYSPIPSLIKHRVPTRSQLQ